MSDVSILNPLSTNDHCTVGARVNLKIHKKAAYLRHVWLYKQANFELFRAGLSDADFDEVFALDHIDDICKAWTEKFLSIAKLFIPIREILVRPNDSPWYCSKLHQMKRKMMRLFRRFKSIKSEASLESYREARNEYQRALDKAEDDYRKSLTDSLADSKNTKGWWHTVKNLLGKGSFSSLPAMEVNNVVISDSKGKAEAFNDFFLSHASIDTSNATLPEDSNFEIRLDSIIASEQEVLD